MTHVPLLRGKIQVSYKEGRALLKTDFAMHVVFDGNSPVLFTLDSHYRGKVYGLCGNFNGDPQSKYFAHTPGTPPINCGARSVLPAVMRTITVVLAVNRNWMKWPSSQNVFLRLS